MRLNFKKILDTVMVFVSICCVAVTIQAFTTPERVSATVSSSSSSKKFVKTTNKCIKCSCSGYWGYKPHNGNYEGVCSRKLIWIQSDRYLYV